MDAAAGNFLDFTYRALVGTAGQASRVSALGYNQDVDTATVPEDVWAGASLGILNAIDHKLIPLPTAAVSMEVRSDSASDTSAGAGARTLLVGYLAAGYIAKTATITLNGTTAVAMPEDVLRINSVLVATAGTNPRGVNIGNISIRATGGAGATYSYMLAGSGIAQSSLYTVPTGRALDLLGLVLSVHQTDTSQRAATFSLTIANSAGRAIKGLFLGLTSNVGCYNHHVNGDPITTVPATSDVWVTAENVSANNTACSAGLIGVLR